MTSFAASQVGSFVASDVGSRDWLRWVSPGLVALLVFIDETIDTYRSPAGEDRWHTDLAAYAAVREELIELELWEGIGALVLVQVEPSPDFLYPLTPDGELYPEDVLGPEADAPPLLEQNPFLEALELVLEPWGGAAHDLVIYIDDSPSMGRDQLEPALSAFVDARLPHQSLEIIEMRDERWLRWITGFVERFLP